jgi:hypothetical protein
MQVFALNNSTNAVDVADKFPQIKLIHWFDIKKEEAEAKVGACCIAAVCRTLVP